MSVVRNPVQLNPGKIPAARFSPVRALQLHPRLALSITLAGLVAALANGFTSWPPAFDSYIHQVVSQVAPSLHPEISAVLVRAMLLVLAGLVLAVLVAVVIHRTDSRVYLAADVEQVLGLAPMVVLPDFDEVSSLAAGEHSLRLSAAIERFCKRGELRSCIFTGAAHEVGVTTLAGQVRDTLVTLGRRTVLLTASGPPDSVALETTETSLQNHSLDLTATRSGNRSSALLKQVEAQVTHQQGLVLADTAPLAISAETEYLAGSVDGAILVIQSGVTTRDQLLTAARSLERLDVRVAGVVLNRVKLANADRAFRRWIRDIEDHIRVHGISSSLRPEPFEQITGELVAARETLKKPEVAEVEAPLAPQAALESTPQPLPLQASNWGDITPALASLTRKTASGAQVPWWVPEEHEQRVAEVTPPVEKRELAGPEPVTQLPPREPLPDWFWDAGTRTTSGASGTTGSTESPTPENEKPPVEGGNPYEAESRLNGLRGLILTLGLKRMSEHQQRESALLQEESSSAAIEPEPSIEPQRFTSFADAGEAATASPAAPEPEVAENTNVPESANVAENVISAKPEFLSPPREFVPVAEAKRVHEAQEEDDEIQILPARRGQYQSNR